LHNIRVRYNKDEIYTSIGIPICISINPYKTLKIYNEKNAKLYKKLVDDIKAGVTIAI